MKPLVFPIVRTKKTKQLIYLIAVIFVLILIGYLIFFNNQFFSGNVSKIPAGIFTFLGNNNNDQPETEAWSDIETEEKTEKYLEKAEKGDGVTHLARKATQKFLEENLQDFKVTDEHKVYVEDYLTKKTNIQSLELNQEVEFSAELIAEAVSKSSELSQSQLDNLTQYSQLVSF